MLQQTWTLRHFTVANLIDRARPPRTDSGDILTTRGMGRNPLYALIGTNMTNSAKPRPGPYPYWRRGSRRTEYGSNDGGDAPVASSSLFSCPPTTACYPPPDLPIVSSFHSAYKVNCTSLLCSLARRLVYSPSAHEQLFPDPHTRPQRIDIDDVRTVCR